MDEQDGGLHGYRTDGSAVAGFLAHPYRLNANNILSQDVMTPVIADLDAGGGKTELVMVQSNGTRHPVLIMGGNGSIPDNYPVDLPQYVSVVVCALSKVHVFCGCDTRPATLAPAGGARGGPSRPKKKPVARGAVSRVAEQNLCTAAASARLDSKKQWWTTTAQHSDGERPRGPSRRGAVLGSTFDVDLRLNSAGSYRSWLRSKARARARTNLGSPHSHRPARCRGALEMPARSLACDRANNETVRRVDQCCRRVIIRT